MMFGLVSFLIHPLRFIKDRRAAHKIFYMYGPRAGYRKDGRP